MKTKLFLLTLPALVLAAACSGDDTEKDQSAESSGRTFQDQVSDGMALYGDHCASCHGDAGQGTEDGPAVVGDTALPRSPEGREVRDVEFVTALDVFEWVSTNMPFENPGALRASEYVDILAFALFANGVELGEPLSADNADDIVLNP